ncbi:FtsX-like permease family protein, partial [Methylophaga lonarensis]|uniref:FtsX-like permease family protein n=1 Tax=Methylophaga lonarensis TaxID=999151 RepID=UPI003D2CC703
LKEPGRVSGAYLSIDQQQSQRLYRQLKDMPAVAGVTLREESRSAIREVMDTGAGAMRFIMTAIAAVISFGVVYNTARISFAERARDLASLRVLGLSRSETGFVLLGELALIALLALPVGCLLGYFLTSLIAEAFSTDLYRIPMAFVPASYGLAMLGVVVAAVVSGILLQRDIHRLDLVSALKIRE